MATAQQKRDLIRLTQSYTNALSNGDSKKVANLAARIRELKEKMK